MKRKLLERPFIKNPFLSNLIELFDSLRHKKRCYGVASCLLLTGESGSGKSELAKHYVKNNPVFEDEERTRIPVLHYELRSVATPEEFLRSLLVAIGDPQQGMGARNKGELYARLVILINTVGLELLILDEIQVIIERRSAKVLTGIADLFKDLIKDTEIPIVFMGMPWSRYLVDSNQQLKRRIAYRYVIPPFRVSQKENRDDYRRLLKLLGDHYGISKKLKIENVTFALRCFAATSGNLSATADLVCDAFMLSEMESKKIDINLFSDVVRRYGVEDIYNAFELPLEKLVLRELVVHSDWNFGTRANKNAIINAEYIEYGVLKENKIYCLTG
jgi:hypothetical protein